MIGLDLRVNGHPHRVHVDDPETPLLYVLRNSLGLHGPRFGCGLGQCGACTVVIDGSPVRSCSLPVSQAKGSITTLEGLGTPQKPHPLQDAFVEEQAVQCGYCINGMIMTASTIISEQKALSEEEIRTAVRGGAIVGH